MKVPKSRKQSGQTNTSRTEESCIGDSLVDLNCEICKIQFTSNKDLLSHQAVYHFKSEITKLLKHYFLYKDNNCRKCPLFNKGIHGATNKIIHVGIIHEVVEKLMKEKMEAEKDPLIILNEVVVKEETIDLEVIIEIKEEK